MPAQAQQISPENSTPAEPTESKKQRALEELLSEDLNDQQALTLNPNNPASRVDDALFIHHCTLKLVDG